MSKKVAILEGDKSRRFSGVKYLRTDLSGGGACEWVPEDEKKLTTKTIKKNGTYKASDEKDKDGQKYYGFSQVTVSVKNSVTGKKKPSTGGDGNEYHIKTNDDNVLEETLLPSSIRIVTQPSKTEYTNGEAISLGGSIVKAYKADGGLWEGQGYSSGVIPHGELTLDPTTASGGTTPEGASSSLDTSPMPQPIPIGSDLVVVREYTDSNRHLQRQVTNISCFAGFVYASVGQSGYFEYLVASNNANDTYTVKTTNIDTVTGEITSSESTSTYQRSTVRNNKTVYFAGTTDGFREATVVSATPLVPVSYRQGDTKEANIAWTIVYGTISGGADSQQIAVKWNRPEDEKELTDAFNITVTASNGGNGGTGGGGAGGGGGGSW